MIDPIALKIQAPVNKDDKISIFFTFDSPIEPRTEVIKAKIIKISSSMKQIWFKKYIGRIFCQEAIIKNNIHSKSIIIFNTQKWKGGMPIFQIILLSKRNKNNDFWSQTLNKKITLISRIIDPIDWIKKYFNTKELFGKNK